MADVVALPMPRSAEESKILAQQALQGDMEAADKKTSFNLLVMGNAKLDWATISAENGSFVGAYNLATTLSDVRSLTDNPYGDYRFDREWFWLKRSADAGYKYAISDLKEAYPDPDKIRPEPEQEIQRWHLTGPTLPQFKRAAMRGSPNAAYRVYQHYSDPKKRLFWARIAAQNGHPQAPYAVGHLLLESPESDDRIRAEFWLKKAATAGDKEAAKLLQAGKEKNSPKP